MKRFVSQTALSVAIAAACSAYPRQATALPFRPALAPMAFSMFCLRNPDDCVRHATDKKRANGNQLGELSNVNALVNTRIKPEPQKLTPDREVWEIAPDKGDCNDYAVTKRHILMKLGWSSEAVRLAVVLTREHEGHLVAVVASPQGDLVLDNLTAEIKPLERTDYTLVKLQTTEHPQRWVEPASRQPQRI